MNVPLTTRKNRALHDGLWYRHSDN